MPEGLPDLYVLISYQQLQGLLQAAGELQTLRYDMKRLAEQVEALRGIQTQCLDKYQELYKLL